MVANYATVKLGDKQMWESSYLKILVIAYVAGNVQLIGSVNVYDTHLIVARKSAGHKLWERLNCSHTMFPTNFCVVENYAAFKLGNGQTWKLRYYLKTLVIAITVNLVYMAPLTALMCASHVCKRICRKQTLNRLKLSPYHVSYQHFRGREPGCHQITKWTDVEIIIFSAVAPVKCLATIG